MVQKEVMMTNPNLGESSAQGEFDPSQPKCSACDREIGELAISSSGNQSIINVNYLGEIEARIKKINTPLRPPPGSVMIIDGGEAPPPPLSGKTKAAS